MKRFTSSTLTVLIAAGLLLIGGVGVTMAATGGTFLLGKSNSATSTTSLTNSAGTALALNSKAGTAPLKVNNSTKVSNLNADKLDGLDSTSLQRRVAGSCALGLKALGSTGTATCVPGVTSFSSPGSHPYTVPAGVHQLNIRIWGAGGGGGGSQTFNFSAGYNGAGGGQGSYLEVLLPVTPGNTLTVVVGAGGTGGDTFTATQADNGGSTTVSLNSVLFATAPGGAGAFDPGPLTCPDDSGAHGFGGNGGQPATADAPAIGLVSVDGRDGGEWHADCGMPISGGAGGGSGYASAGAGGDGAASADLNPGLNGSAGLVLITPVG